MNTTLSLPYLNAPQLTVVDQRAAEKFLAPLEEIASHSDYLIAKPLGEYERAGRSYQIPRYVFLGPQGGGDTIRLGIFATIHGDEPEGALGLVRFLRALERNPDLAKGYALFIYPLCNPTGFEDNTRHSRAGVDLNREFWINSEHPEVRALETEIWTHAFHGIVTLHSDDTSDGLYGFVNGAMLSEYLLEPALRAAEAFLPRNQRGTIDGFPANRGIINSCYKGVLKSPQGLAHSPFEITFETPQRLAPHLQVEAVNAALHAILGEYRTIISVAQNI